MFDCLWAVTALLMFAAPEPLRACPSKVAAGLHHSRLPKHFAPRHRAYLSRNVVNTVLTSPQFLKQHCIEPGDQSESVSEKNRHCVVLTD